MAHSKAVATSRNMSNYSSHSTYLFPITLYFLNCTNVSLINITVSHSAGTGLALFDTVGNVTVVNCSFKDNKVRERLTLVYPGGGGLYVEFTKINAPLNIWETVRMIVLHQQMPRMSSIIVILKATMLPFLMSLEQAMSTLVHRFKEWVRVVV